MSDIPRITLDARDIHVPTILKALAAKARVMDPARAAMLDKTANDFAAWKQANPNVR
jgi:hypothetical protein